MNHEELEICRGVILDEIIYMRGLVKTRPCLATLSGLMRPRPGWILGALDVRRRAWTHDLTTYGRHAPPAREKRMLERLSSLGEGNPAIEFLRPLVEVSAGLPNFVRRPFVAASADLGVDRAKTMLMESLLEGGWDTMVWTARMGPLADMARDADHLKLAGEFCKLWDRAALRQLEESRPKWREWLRDILAGKALWEQEKRRRRGLGESPRIARIVTFLLAHAPEEGIRNRVFRYSFNPICVGCPTRTTCERFSKQAEYMAESAGDEAMARMGMGRRSGRNSPPVSDPFRMHRELLAIDRESRERMQSYGRKVRAREEAERAAAVISGGGAFLPDDLSDPVRPGARPPS